MSKIIFFVIISCAFFATAEPETEQGLKCYQCPEGNFCKPTPCAVAEDKKKYECYKIITEESESLRSNMY